MDLNPVRKEVLQTIPKMTIHLRNKKEALDLLPYGRKDPPKGEKSR